MRACVIHAARDLRIDEIATGDPGPGQLEVAIALGGICGSDLHYFAEGAVGAFRVQQPMVLGHEIVGTVVRLGPGVAGPAVGTRIAVDPRMPCGACALCSAGRPNLCPNGTFLGSAARMPHIQGGFRERLVMAATQAVPLPDGLPFERAVFAEPLAVALHAVHRAGDVRGRHVLIAGGGPIGQLAVLAARRAGVGRITVTDRLAGPLAMARRNGADATVDVGEGSPLPEADVAIEATGSPRALEGLLGAVVRGGRIVLVGLLPPAADGLPLHLAVTRELELLGSFRFNDEFRGAVAALDEGLDVSPLLTEQRPLDEAGPAFELALDRARSMKVQLRFHD
jgi:L-idonate 5-dehydrogenase